jgi:hypothetical protein
MRRLLLVALLALTLPLTLACKHPEAGGDAGGDGAAAASASASGEGAVPDAAADASSGPAAHGAGFGPPAAGAPCRAGTDTLGCSSDHSVELTCSGGVWRAMQACRGAGVCKGAGGGVTCDLGNLLIGDPCVTGSPPAHCAPGNHAVQQCNGGRWAENLCMPPSSCKPNGNGGQAGCK